MILVREPKSEEEELERLGSVQGGKVDWSMYEWAKYTYEMWIMWDKCSFHELAKKMGVDNKQIAVRVKVFQYYQHSEIEDKLANGVYTLFALYYLIIWLEKLDKFKNDLVQRFNMDLIRVTMLRKIELGLVTVNDLKNEMLIRTLSDEQIKTFLVNINLRFSDVTEENIVDKVVGSSKLKTHQVKIKNALININQIDAKNIQDADELLNHLNNLKAEVAIKLEYLNEFL
ncbi:hypothetical protein [Paenibacillus lacisoli]